MRHVLIAFSLLAGLHGANAQSFPQRTVRIVVPFAPGGVVDTVARTAGAHMQEALGQAFVVENKAGAGGSVGAGEVARAEPDGHTLLFVFDTHAVAADLIRSLSYDPVSSFEPVALVVTSPLVMVARPDFPAGDFNELVDLAKKQPVSYASVGSGSLGHVAFEELSSRHAIKMAHVPYRGAAPALNDLMGGHADIMLTTIGTSLSLIQGGKVKAITLLSDERSKALPDLATIKEQTGRAYSMISYVGALAPAKTPAPIVARLNDEVRRAFETEPTRTKFEGLGFDVRVGSPEQFKAFLEEQRSRIGSVIRKFGISSQ